MSYHASQCFSQKPVLVSAKGSDAPSLFAGTGIEMGCRVLFIVALKADFLSPWIEECAATVPQG